MLIFFTWCCPSPIPMVIQISGRNFDPDLVHRAFDFFCAVCRDRARWYTGLGI
jgi:hypothetical protein